MKNKIKKTFLYNFLKKQYLKTVYLFDYLSFKKQDKNKRFSNYWHNRFPCLKDKTDNTPIDRHYIYHTAWAARKIKEINPAEHIDISSYLYLSTIASAFVPIKFYDYRPAPIKLENFTSKQANLTKLHFKNNSVKSLSCLHTIEHIGLGRYGDPIDPDGDLKAIKELQRIIKTKGNLLIVVPIGRPKIMFNAHRIYSYKQIINLFYKFELKEFSLVSDDKNIPLIINATEQQANEQNYGCGCFWFTKI